MDYENLANDLYAVWNESGLKKKDSKNGISSSTDPTTSYLNRTELIRVCLHVGLRPKIADQLADEVFEKLGRDPREARLNFNEFVALLQTDNGDSNDNGDGGGDDGRRRSTPTAYDPISDLINQNDTATMILNRSFLNCTKINGGFDDSVPQQSATAQSSTSLNLHASASGLFYVLWNDFDLCYFVYFLFKICMVFF